MPKGNRKVYALVSFELNPADYQNFGQDWSTLESDLADSVHDTFFMEYDISLEATVVIKLESEVTDGKLPI